MENISPLGCGNYFTPGVKGGGSKMWLLITLFIIIIVALLTFIIRYKKDVKYITKQIINSKGEYHNLKMNTIDKDLEKLALSINNLYEINQKINVKIRHSEEELRCSIANMCHDLRTPLTSIMGYIQLIDEGKLTKEQRFKYMDIVKKRTSRLQDLITNFYELSRVESGDYKFNLQCVNLSDILCETIALFYNDFTKNHIEPHININGNVASIITDEKAVMRIFSNLINNMIKHGEKNVSVSLRKETDYIVTEFSNNAPNLKDADVKHIFDRTFTADSTRSNENTGLGLSITKALVEQLGHKIEAELCDSVLTISIWWK